MFQVKKRHDAKSKTRFMVTICFYQDSRHDKPLFWIRSKLGIGYVSHRNDGMTELRINGYAQAEKILSELLPYIRFKKKQAQALLKAIKVLSCSKFALLSQKQLERLVDLVLLIQQENYVTKRKKTKSELLANFGLTP